MGILVDMSDNSLKYFAQRAGLIACERADWDINDVSRQYDTRG